MVTDSLACSKADHQQYYRIWRDRFGREGYKNIRRVIRRADQARETAHREGIVPEPNSTGGLAGLNLRPVTPPPLEDEPDGSKVEHRFHAKTTYCVQTCQYACGFPIAWGKCYRSESSTQVLALLNKWFQPGNRPGFVGYDNACKLLAHMFTSADISSQSWLNTTCFIVDTFHYINHRAHDRFCRTLCNPAPADGSQPDLVILKKDANGVIHSVRAFNLETAEQLNSWLNPFEGPMKQMSNIRFDFTFHALMLLYKEDAEDRILVRERKAAAAAEAEIEDDEDD